MIIIIKRMIITIIMIIVKINIVTIIIKVVSPQRNHLAAEWLLQWKIPLSARRVQRGQVSLSQGKVT